MSESHKPVTNHISLQKNKNKNGLKILNLDTVLVKIKQIVLKIQSKIITLMHLFYFFAIILLFTNVITFSIINYHYI